MSPQRSQVDFHILSSLIKDSQKEEDSSKRQGSFSFSKSLNVWQQEMREVIGYRDGLDGKRWPTTLSCFEGFVTSEGKQNRKPIARH